MRNGAPMNIWGSCVSRESFNSDVGPRYNILEYIFLQSPFFIDDGNPPGYFVDSSQSILPSNFQKRSMQTIINGAAKERLLKNKGEWLIIDSLYFTSPVLKIHDKKTLWCRYIQSPQGKEVKRILGSDERFADWVVERMSALPYLTPAHNLIKYLNQYYDRGKIIIIDAKYADYYIDERGNISSLEPAINQHELEMIQKELISRLVKYCGAKYISAPFPYISDYYLRNDKSKLHYISECYDYQKECIDAIVAGTYEQNKSLLDIKYQNKIYKILSGINVSSGNSIGILKKNLRTDENASLFQLIRLKESDSPYYEVGYALFLIETNEKNKMIDAIQLLRNHLSGNVNWMLELYILTCFKINDQRLVQDAINILNNTNPKYFNKKTCFLIAKVIENNNLVENSYNEATKWYRLSYEKGYQPALINLYDHIIAKGNIDEKEEIIKKIIDLSNKGNTSAKYRYSLLLIDGKYVSADVIEAEKLLKQCADKGDKRAVALLKKFKD